MIFRFKLVLIIVGGALAFFGIQELMVSCGTSGDAAVVNLADLESGGAVQNNHIQVGPHIAFYPGAVYEYEEATLGAGQTRDSKVNHCYYPILSPDHPFIQAIKQDDEYIEPENIAVLVKTKRFKTVGAIPDDPEHEQSVQGLVINQIGSLDREEKVLVNESFPKIDVSELLILEEGREPAPLLKSMGMTLGGLTLIIVGVGLFFVGRGSGS